LKTAPPIRPPALAPAGGSLVVGRRPATAPVEPGVDPRISARRVAVQREEGQRRMRRLAWIGGAIGTLLVALAATRTPLLDLDHVEVAGTDDPAVAEALAEAGIRTGRPLVDLDIASGVAAVERLPWVADADIRRRWPGTLEVDVTARIPVASVPVTGGTALVAADGVVVAIQPGPSPLVAVEGPPDLAVGDRFERRRLVTVAAALPDSLRPLVAAVAAPDGGGVALRLVDGGLVRLGSGQALEAKLVAADTVLTQVDRSCLAVVDVRVPSVPTVTRRSPC
jgi:cell division protein FtsQ